jgi:hypothetical protein
LLLFGAEFFVFQLVIKKDIKKYNFDCSLYGCATWSLTIGEERRLRVFENRMLRRLFGPKRNEVTGEWKQHTEELYGLSALQIFL